MRKWLVAAVLLAACGREAKAPLSPAQQKWEEKRCLVSRVVNGRVECRFCQIEATPEQVAAAEADPRQADFLKPYGGPKALARGVEVCTAH